jgi:hypothetical protein
MKKTLLFLSFICLFSLTSNSQTKENFSFGAGAYVATPIGDLWVHDYGIGIGLVGTARYKISSNFEVYSNLGITQFKGKTVKDYYGSYTNDNLTTGSLTFGGRYVSNSNFLAGLSLGYGVAGIGGAFFSPEVGYRFSKIDLILSGEAASIFGSAGAKIYYNF